MLMMMLVIMSDRCIAGSKLQAIVRRCHPDGESSIKLTPSDWNPVGIPLEVLEETRKPKGG